MPHLEVRVKASDEDYQHAVEITYGEDDYRDIGDGIGVAVNALVYTLACMGADGLRISVSVYPRERR